MININRNLNNEVISYKYLNFKVFMSGVMCHKDTLQNTDKSAHPNIK